jgi:hypothetical protein
MKELRRKKSMSDSEAFYHGAVEAPNLGATPDPKSIA